MSDNWIVQNLNSALSTWSEKMAELWTLLTENPATFKGGGIWRIMVNINDALTAIAYGLLVLFFAAGIIKTCGSFTDLKKPEHVLKAFPALKSAFVPEAFSSSILPGKANRAFP